MGIHMNGWYFFCLKPKEFVLESCKTYYWSVFWLTVSNAFDMSKDFNEKIIEQYYTIHANTFFIFFNT